MSAKEAKRSTAALTGRSMISVCAALVGLAATASAQNAISVVTSENPAQPGAFTLNFGDLGFVTSSNITTTTYELSVDPFEKTAHFVSYLQHVQPLTLPGGISTGDITVEVVDGSSSGIFDPFTRTFTTSELYAIHFTGDLSAFGLTSPVLLPSSSTGALVADPVSGGSVTMDWSGVGQLANPFDPENPITFTYVCGVNTVFEPTPASAVGVDLTSDVVALQLPQTVQTSLVNKLYHSLGHVQRGSDARAVYSLRAFIRQVDQLSGTVIDEPDATDLISEAADIIELIRNNAPPSAFPGGLHEVNNPPQ